MFRKNVNRKELNLIFGNFSNLTQIDLLDKDYSSLSEFLFEMLFTKRNVDFEN